MTTWLFPGAVLERVVDGDTFIARLTRTADFGFHVISTLSSVQRFRLNRAAAAPASTDSGAGAARALTEMLSGAPFLLTSVGPYKFGDEWMAEVVLADDRNVTDTLIAEQWAALWSGRGAQPLPPWPRTV
jgi:hypothetical protein